MKTRRDYIQEVESPGDRVTACELTEWLEDSNVNPAYDSIYHALPCPTTMPDISENSEEGADHVYVLTER
jgi:hypothetical protein